MISPQYKAQADLLLQIIPIIAKEEILSLIVKWKLQNIHRLILENPEKHAKLLTSLKESILNESKF